MIMSSYNTLFESRTDNAGKTIVNVTDITKSQRLLTKAATDLRHSTEPGKDPSVLLEECIGELVEKGFLVSVNGNEYAIHDLKEDLRKFILMKLSENGGKPAHFEAIHVWIT